MTKVAVLQLNPIVGDFDGNFNKILSALDSISQTDTFGPDDWLVLPFSAIGGWPLKELRFNPTFISQYQAAAAKLIPHLTAFAGHYIFIHPGMDSNAFLRSEKQNNSQNNQQNSQQSNSQSSGHEQEGEICPFEYDQSLIHFVHDRLGDYREMFRNACAKKGRPGVYSNIVGGQDRIIYEGGSLICNAKGEIVASAPKWQTDNLVYEFQPEDFITLPDEERVAKKYSTRVNPTEVNPAQADPAQTYSAGTRNLPVTDSLCYEDMYEALVLGVRDYVRKNGFRGAIVGLSGGIDSALSAAIAVAALGPEDVIGVTMPSRYTSSETRSDAETLAASLGIQIYTLPLEKPYNAFSDVLEPVLSQFDPGLDAQNLTDQNLQARLRAIYLMALSNRTGKIVLNTSNKSEGSVGYGTLYGDLIGGLAVISDLWKTQVWELARWINNHAGREVIPNSTIERVPSAELRPNQEDRQSIPDYPVLDPIMQLYLRNQMSIEEIAAKGYDESAIRLTIRLYNRSEYKRNQCVPGLIVSTYPLGSRPRPITSKFDQ